MTDETQSAEASNTSNTVLFYIVGGIVLVVIVAAAFLLRPRPEVRAPLPAPVSIPTPIPGPITALGCENQYFNPKIGFAEYYLSVEGVDIRGAKTVTCDMSAKVGGTEVSKAQVVSPVTDAPPRGGGTFRCTTNALALVPNVGTVVDVTLTDDLGSTASCSATFSFPAL